MSSPKKWELSRRHFLRGAGLTLALPMLEVMVPWIKRAEAAGTAESSRIWFSMEMCNGFAPDGDFNNGAYPFIKNTVAAAGADKYCHYFNKFTRRNSKDHENIIHAIVNSGNGHSIPNLTMWNDGPGSLINAIKAGSCNTPQGGPWQWKPSETIQGRLARDTNSTASVPLLSVMTDRSGDGGSECFSATKHNINIMAKNDGTYYDHYDDPMKIYNMLTGGVSTGTTTGSGTTTAQADLVTTSVLDAVLGDYKDLYNKVGKSDRQQLDSFASSLRDTEVAIGRTPTAPTSGSGSKLVCTPLPDTKAWNTATYMGRHNAMKQLMVLGMKCGAFRYIYFRPASEGANPRGIAGFTGGATSWHMHGPSYNDLRYVQTWVLKEFSDIVRQVAATPNGAGGSLLDQTLLTFTSANQDGDGHNFYNLQWVQAGMPSLLKNDGGTTSLNDADIQQLVLSYAQLFNPSMKSWGKYGSSTLSQIRKA